MKFAKGIKATFRDSTFWTYALISLAWGIYVLFN